MSNLNTVLDNNYGLVGDMIGKYAQANIEAWKFLVESQIGFTDLWAECFRENLERLSDVRNQDEIFSIQSDLLTEYSGRFSDQIQQAVNTLTETQSDIMGEYFKGSGLPSIFAIPEKSASRKTTRKRANSKQAGNRTKPE